MNNECYLIEKIEKLQEMVRELDEKLQRIMDNEEEERYEALQFPFETTEH